MNMDHRRFIVTQAPPEPHRPRRRARRLRAPLAMALAGVITVPLTLSATGQEAPLPEPVIVLDDFSDTLPEGQPIQFAGDGYAYTLLQTPDPKAPAQIGRAHV